ncbi:hypothetical protein RvY_15253 [Ramazzottius varieornatus]|uniref:RRM domain-containing protein n=1 Tax=Ramazzottius varieornatus TaxID=947166 RepID=A0A1D1VU80_RAMVA|nr:hypothetical protein RvY_15253 [Ramazzottius varieornatus]
MEEIEKTLGVTGQAWQKYFSRIWTDPELYHQWRSPEFKSPENRPHPQLTASIDALIACQLFPDQLSRFHNALYVLNTVMPLCARIFRLNGELYNLIRSAEIDGYSARERSLQDGRSKFRADQSLTELEKMQLVKTPYATKSKEEENMFYDQISFFMMNHWNRTVCLEKIKQTVFSDAHLSSVNVHFGFLAVVNECLGLAEQEVAQQARPGQPNSSLVIATFPLHGATALGLPTSVPSRKQETLAQGTLFAFVKRIPNLAVMLAQLTRRLERVLSNYFEPGVNAADLNPLIRPTATFNADKASCQVELRDKTGKSVVFVVEILFSFADAVRHTDLASMFKRDTTPVFDESLRSNVLFLLREYFLLKHIVVCPDLRFTISLVLGIRSVSESLRHQVSSWDVVMIMWTLSQLAPLENPGVAMTRFFAVVEQGRLCEARSSTAPFSSLPLPVNPQGPSGFFHVENFGILNCDSDKIPATTTNIAGVLSAIFKKNIEKPVGVEMTLEQKRQWRADEVSIRKYVLQKMIGIPPPSQFQQPPQPAERQACSPSLRNNRDRRYHSDDRRPDRYRDQDRSSYNQNNRHRGRSSSAHRGRQDREEQHDRRGRSPERQDERQERSREWQDGRLEGPRDDRRRIMDREDVRQVQPRIIQSNSSGEDSGVESQRNSPEDEHQTSQDDYMPAVHNYLEGDANMYDVSVGQYGQGYTEPEQVGREQEKAGVMDFLQEPEVVHMHENSDVEMVGELTSSASQQLIVTVDNGPRENDSQINGRKDSPSQFSRFFVPRKNTEILHSQPTTTVAPQGEKRRSLEAFGTSENGRPAKQMLSPPQPVGGASAPAERFHPRPSGMKYGQAQPSGSGIFGKRRLQGPGRQDPARQLSPSGERSANPPGTTLYVIEQRRGSSDPDLANLFSQFGKVQYVYSRPSGWHHNTDFAYVIFGHAADASKALQYIQTKELMLNGRSLLLAPDDNKEAKNILYNSPNVRGRFDVCLRGLPLSVGVKYLMDYLTARVSQDICNELDDVCVQKGKGYALLSFKEAWRAENFLKTFEKKSLVLDEGVQAQVIIARLSLRFDPLRPKPSLYPLPPAMSAPESFLS